MYIHHKEESPNSKGFLFDCWQYMEEIELKSLIKELVTFSQDRMGWIQVELSF
jgi:hypothetical protein